MCREARGEESETCMGSQERRHREGSRGLGQGRKGAGRVSLKQRKDKGEHWGVPVRACSVSKWGGERSVRPRSLNVHVRPHHMLNLSS